MKSFFVVAFVCAIVLASIVEDASACEIKRKGDCCYRWYGKECMTRPGRTTIYTGSNGCMIQKTGDCCYSNGKMCCRTNPMGQTPNIECY